MAKAVVPSLDQVPEALRSEYERQTDGTFALKVEGVPVGYADSAEYNRLKAKEGELRETNIKLLKASGEQSLEGALAKLGIVTAIDASTLEKLKAVDPAEYNRLKTKEAELRGRGVDNADDLDAKIQARVDAAILPVTQKLAKTETELATERQRTADSTLRTMVSEKFLKVGGKAKALDFIVEQAKGSFQVEAGAVKAKADKYSAEKPGAPLSVDEWLAGQAKENDFAFEPSAGGGASGNGRGAGVPGPGHDGTLRTPSGEKLNTDGITILS
jgi:hypothetical protein